MSKKSKHNTQPTMYKPPVLTYSVGFILSIILTLIPYLIVTKHLLTSSSLVATLVVFALLQLFVQLQYFLHLGNEPKPRWNLMVFSFMVGIVLIIVIGSLWIMKNLNYHMHTMDSKEKTQYMFDEEGKPN